MTLAAVLLTAAVVAAPAEAAGAVILVSTTADEYNPAGNGNCSLREAVTNANANAAVMPDCAAGVGADRIRLPGPATYMLTISGAADDTARRGDLDILDSVLIVGWNGTATIDAAPLNPRERVFHVVAPKTVFTVQELIVQGGEDVDGGGIAVMDGSLILSGTTVRDNTANGRGGGLYVAAGKPALLMGGTWVVYNTALNNGLPGGVDGDGGGIYNEGNILVQGDSEISWNTADSSGGGIYNLGGSFALTNSTITNNVALLAGGIQNDAGTVTLSDCGVQLNTGTIYGGGIFSDGGTLTVTHCGIHDNYGRDGAGGLGIEDGGTLTLTNSEVTGNTCDLSFCTGGGLFINNGIVEVTDTQFAGNSAHYGGGIYMHQEPNGGVPAIIRRSRITGNTATDSGGGISVDKPSNEAAMAIWHSTIDNNTAEVSGGGIQHYGGILTLTNSTVSTNTAQDGGGIHVEGHYGRLPTTALNNVTIGRNSANTGGGIRQVSGTITARNTIVAQQTSGDDCAGSVVSDGYNLESGTTCAFNDPGDLQNAYAGLAALQGNGGPTPTHGLFLGLSEAIDAGNPAGCSADTDGDGVSDMLLTTDQRLRSRPVDAACEIGAYEVQ